MHTLILFAFAGIASSYPGHELQYRQVPSASGLSRSPCPALNVLANIGKLPNNGLNITADMFKTSLSEVYNVDPSFAETLAKQGLSTVPHVASNALNLGDLSAHNKIEHDASLVHADFSTGDNSTPQKALLDALLADAEGDFITITSIAKTRRRRESESQKAGNPALSTFLSTLATGESALLLQVLGQFGPPGAGEYAVPKAAARQWLLEERLPEGFQKPKTPISLSSTGVLSAKILAAKGLGGLFGSDVSGSSSPPVVKPMEAMPVAPKPMAPMPMAPMPAAQGDFPAPASTAPITGSRKACSMHKK